MDVKIQNTILWLTSMEPAFTVIHTSADVGTTYPFMAKSSKFVIIERRVRLMNKQEMIKFATDQLDVFASDSDMGKFLQSVIKELTKKKWISVDERLPKKDGYYLVTSDFVDHKTTSISLYENGIFYNNQYYPNTSVIAWMPIPKYHFAEADKKIGGAE